MKRFILMFVVSLFTTCVLKADESQISKVNKDFVQDADTVYNADCIDPMLHTKKLHILAEYNNAYIECDSLQRDKTRMQGNLAFLMDMYNRKDNIYRK